MGLRSVISKIMHTAANIRRALGYVWKSSRKWTVANTFLLIIQGLLPIASLYLLKMLVDAVSSLMFESSNEATMPRDVLLVLAAAAFVALLTALSRTLGTAVNNEQGRRVSDYMHDIIQTKAVQVDLAYYENSAYHDSLHRAQEESVYRPKAIMHGLTTVFQQFISLCGVAWLLLGFSWPVLLLLVIALLPAMFVRLIFSQRAFLRERSYTKKERRAAYYYWMIVNKDFAKEIRMFGLGKAFIHRFSVLRAELRKMRLSLDLRSARYTALANITSTVLVFAAYLWVARDAIAGRVSIGEFVLFYQAFQRGQTFLRAFFDGLASLYENNLFLENLYEFLDIPAGIGVTVEATEVTSNECAAVEFEDVRFRYPGTSTEVLKGVSLRLETGKVAALVGLNGAGKTTLVKLLGRLYDIDKGRILIDGIDIRALEPEILRQRIGVVFQDYVQYNLTARENIWFGDVSRNGDTKGIAAAARMAGIDETIRSFGEGYDSVLGRLFESGYELSVGEWQKVALARAFFRGTEFIVLDEPTSSMDAKAEYQLFNSFREILNGRTALLISHRMSTVRMADTIFVLDDGRIAESGSHAELMAVDGIYRDLFEAQASRYTVSGR
jgi:ATP-binding cassette, subfamily B, bacterial